MLEVARIKPVAIAALACAMLVALSVIFVDRPVEAFVATHILPFQPLVLFFDGMASPSLLPMPSACLFLAFYTLRSVLGVAAGPRARLGLRLSVATAAAIMAKDELKWLFGRPWPATWLNSGSYALRPFSNDMLYGGFPSGHTTYIAAPMFVLWWCLPKYRPLWLAIIFSVMIGLVLSGHHFVGDVIAGLFLGLAAASGTLALWPSRQRQAVLL